MPASSQGFTIVKVVVAEAVEVASTSAPMARTASSFTRGTSAGMAMTARMPKMRAAAATPCAWLPDEKATTPRALSAGSSAAILL